MEILYINACVRKESRTDRIAKRLLKKLGSYTELILEEEGLKSLDREALETRTALIECGDYSAESFRYAKQFANADIIVVSAPFWDLSFPSLLKTYLENVYVTGIVSEYGGDGIPVGLCKANKLYYITTAGGPYNGAYSYDFMHDLSINHFGIKETELIAAEMLDVEGYDSEKILEEVFEKYDL